MDESNSFLFPYGTAALDEYGNWLNQVLALQASWLATAWVLQTSCAMRPWVPPPWLFWQPGTEQLA